MKRSPCEGKYSLFVILLSVLVCCANSFLWRGSTVISRSVPSNLIVLYPIPNGVVSFDRTYEEAPIHSIRFSDPSTEFSLPDFYQMGRFHFAPQLHEDSIGVWESCIAISKDARSLYLNYVPLGNAPNNNGSSFVAKADLRTGDINQAWNVTQTAHAGCIAIYILEDSLLFVSTLGVFRLWLNNTIDSLYERVNVTSAVYAPSEDLLMLFSDQTNTTTFFSTANSSLTLMHSCDALPIPPVRSGYFFSNGSVYVMLAPGNFSIPFAVLPLSGDALDTCTFSNFSIESPVDMYMPYGHNIDGYFYIHERIDPELAIEVNTQTLDVAVIPLFPHMNLYMGLVFFAYRTVALATCYSLGCGPCVVEKYFVGTNDSDIVRNASVTLSVDPFDIVAEQTVTSDERGSEAYLLSVRQNCENYTVDLIRLDSDLTVRSTITWVSTQPLVRALFLDSVTQILYVAVYTDVTGHLLGFSVPDLELVANYSLVYEAMPFSEVTPLVNNGLWYNVQYPDNFLAMWNLTTGVQLSSVSLNTSEVFGIPLKMFDAQRVVVFTAQSYFLLNASDLSIISNISVPCSLSFPGASIGIVQDDSILYIVGTSSTWNVIYVPHVTTAPNVSIIAPLELGGNYFNDPIALVMQDQIAYVPTAFGFMFRVSLLSSPPVVTRLECPNGALYAFAFNQMLNLARDAIIDQAFLDCPSGSVRNFTSGMCQTCQRGSVSATGDAQSCSPCFFPTESDLNLVTCVCGKGYFSPPSSTECQYCPEGGNCTGQNHLEALPGWWRANSSSTRFYACQWAAACNATGCAKGYSGVLCGTCERGYGPWSNECIGCPSRGLTIFVWVLIFCVYAALFVFLWRLGDRWQSSYGPIKTLLSFYQVITYPLSYPLPPVLLGVVRQALTIFSLANFRFIASSSLDCLLGKHISFYTQLLLTGFAPFVIILLLVLTYYGYRAFICCESVEVSSSPLVAHLDRYQRSGSAIRLCLFVVLLTFPSVANLVIQYFMCQTVESQWYLSADLSLHCYDSTWFAYLPAAIILLLLVPIGTPIAFWVLLRYHREKIDISFLHKSYKEDFYWWDVVELTRKLLLLLGIVLGSIFGDTTFNLTISVLALAVHLQVKPYKSEFDHWMQTGDLVGIFLVYAWLSSSAQRTFTVVLAWIAFVYAVLYTLLSLGSMCWKIGQRVREWWRSRSDEQKPIIAETSPLLPNVDK